MTDSTINPLSSDAERACEATDALEEALKATLGLVGFAGAREPAGRAGSMERDGPPLCDVALVQAL